MKKIHICISKDPLSKVRGTDLRADGVFPLRSRIPLEHHVHLFCLKLINYAVLRNHMLICHKDMKVVYFHHLSNLLFKTACSTPNSLIISLTESHLSMTVLTQILTNFLKYCSCLNLWQRSPCQWMCKPLDYNFMKLYSYRNLYI